MNQYASHQPFVFVVDDDRDLREALEETLGDEGCRVESAPDGASALAKLRTLPEKPSVLLLDLMMPGMNGWEFRAEQLKDPALAEICTVVMTADANVVPETIEADHFMRKPLHLDALIDQIRNCGKSR